MRIEIPLVIEFEIDEETGILDEPYTSLRALQDTEQADMAIFESGSARSVTGQDADHMLATFQRHALRWGSMLPAGRPRVTFV